MESNRIEIICKNNGKRIKVPIGANIEEIRLLAGVQTRYKVMGALVNNKIMGLSTPIYRNKSIEFIDLGSTSGMRIYVRSLIFVLYKAINDTIPGAKLRIEHPISTGYYVEISKDGKMIDTNTLASIKAKMHELVNADIPFELFYRPTVEVEKMFREAGAQNTANLLKYVKDYYSIYYTLEGLPDFYQSLLTPSTGCLEIFDIVPYFDGFFLALPSVENPETIAPPEFLPKTFETFKEYWSWCRIMGITDIADINKVKKEDLNRLIKIAEALHEKKIVQIADRILKDKRIKLILIAGPSSSGKTTFSKRISIQLAASGIFPLSLSLDNYFVNRDQTPIDENGEHDFESLYSLDLPYFHKQMEQLAKGEEVETPIYNFETGRREAKGVKMRLREGQVILIEGIHALNPELTKTIPDEEKFKVFVSPLTSLSINDHNWIPTEDIRILRRIIRDHKYRSYSGEDTILRWGSVRRGENKWILPYSENADAMFNSSLLFELQAIRRQAEPILMEVRQDSDAYPEARRLLKLLRLFVPISYFDIPSTSLLREFLGGSGFRY